jgi:hypothetical protein
MSFEKNTVDSLKEYAIRYKKILLGFLYIVLFFVGKNLYNKWNFWVFNKSLVTVNQQVNDESFGGLNKFFSQNFSKIIGHRSIFVASYFYTNAIKLLMIRFKNKENLIKLINEGQWVVLKKSISSMDNKDQRAIMETIDNLENLYQFVLKRKPYISVLNGKYIHQQGELLNVLVFIHITSRENKDVVREFFHKSCLHLSIYSTYTKFLFQTAINPREPMNMEIYSDNTKGNLLKKFINF